MSSICNYLPIFIIGLNILQVSFTLEYCQSETFRPICQQDEVILITTALYGRMKFGKCVKEEQEFKAMWSDRQYLGCQADVFGMICSKCTGKRDCDVKIPDPELEKTRPCYSSLKMYLEVNYICIKIAQDNRQCMISLANDLIIHILKSQKEGSCGTIRQPWIAEALTGQTITINRLPTERKTTEGGFKMNGRDLKKQFHFCPPDQIEGYLIDKSNKGNTTICNTNDESHPFTSSSNVIEIVFKDISKNDDKILFFKLQATGCSDLIPPVDAWLKRTENEAIIGCYSTRLRWQLKCIGQRWIGVIGNCSYVESNIPETREFKKAPQEESHIKADQMFTITIICAIGIILSSLIICSGIICLNRYKRRSKLVESVLKERQILANGSLVKNPKYHNEQSYIHYYEPDNDKTNDETIENQGQYFVLDKDIVTKEERANI